MSDRPKTATRGTVKADEARRVTVGRRFTKVRAIEHPVDGYGLMVELDRAMYATREEMRARSIRILEAAGIPVSELLERSPYGSLVRDYVLNSLDHPSDSELGLAARIVELCNHLDGYEELGYPASQIISTALHLGRLDALAKVYRITDETTAPALRKGGEARRKYTDKDRERWAARWHELRAVNGRMSFSAAAARIAADFGDGRGAERTIREYLATLQK